MSNCRTLHETVIKDVIDLVADAKDTAKEVNWITKKDRNFTSVAKASSNLTLVFPVMVSRSLDIQNAAMISKAIERKCVSMLQMLFAATSIDNAEDVYDYISQFHTNISAKDHLSVDDFLTFTGGLAKLAESGEMIKITDADAFEMLKEDMKNLNYFVADTISKYSINDYKVTPNRGVSESAVVLEYNDDWRQELERDKLIMQSDQNDKVNSRENKKLEMDRAKSELMKDQWNKEFGLKNKAQVSKDKSSAIQDKKNRQDILRGQILDSDIKKANELIPTSMVVNFVSTAGDTPIKVDNAVIGVKAKLYPVDSMDIVNRIASKHVDNNWLKQVIRASTREISFWKDLIFAIDKAKIDAISNSRRGSSSKMWKVLERRATKQRLSKWKKNVSSGYAITTLVMTQDEVEYLKKSNNINMENEKIARSIMSSYNLMCICIVDEAAETASFLFDTDDDMYETLSFNSLEREGNDGSYRKVINLMTKMSR